MSNRLCSPPRTYSSVTNRMHDAPPERTLDGTDFFHAATQVDQVCDLFVRAWRSGQRPRIEEYLSAVPEAARSKLLIELIREEVALRRTADGPIAGWDLHALGIAADARRTVFSPHGQLPQSSPGDSTNERCWVA